MDRKFKVTAQDIKHLRRKGEIGEKDFFISFIHSPFLLIICILYLGSRS
jgi:hypothetical protein